MGYDPNEALKLKNQLCFPLYAAARRVTGVYTPYLKPLGLTYTQYIVFMVLWEQDGLQVSEIGEKLLLDSGTLTPLLKKMEAQGYLTRTRSKLDERSVIVTLTEKGKALKTQVGEIPLKAAQRVRLSPEEGKVLYDLLYKLLATTQDFTDDAQ